MQSRRLLGWLLLAALGLTGCSRQDTERLGKIGGIIGQRVELVIGDAEDDFLRRWQQARSRRDRERTDVAGQITQRIQQEKGLADCRVQVTVEGDQVELRGHVKDMQQRRQVLEIATAVCGAGYTIKNHLQNKSEAPDYSRE